MARRCLHVKILSDNRVTFKAADEMTSSIHEHPIMKECFSGAHVQWTFNLTKGPLERMVKSVKGCHRKTIGRRKLDLEDVEEEPITPSHLICGHRLMCLPNGPYHVDLEDNFLEHSVVTKRLIELNEVLNHFLDEMEDNTYHS